MSILVVAEHNNQQLNPATLSAVSAALKLGDTIDLLVAGNYCQAVADQAVAVANVNRVLVADNPAYDHFLAESMAPLIADIADANFSSMSDQMALTQGWKQEKQVNLNLKKRRERENQFDQSLLAIENKRRINNNLKAYADMKAWEKDKDNEDKKDAPTAENDPMLFETGLILSDQIRLLGSAITVKTNEKIASNTNK